MCFKKVLFILLFLLNITTICFAQKNPYDKADKATQIILDKVDSLINAKQYESAFNTLENVDNEYVLAKRIEVTINCFAQSIMHQMFAFKNLDEDETLYDVRTGDGSYNLIMFDPVKAVASYTEKYGEKPILNYALGLYYNDVLYRYQGQWLISDDELIENVIKYLQKAYDEDCFSYYSLSNLAYSYYHTNKLSVAQEIYENIVTDGFDLSANDCFNLSAIYFRLNDTENLPKTLTYAKKIIEGYSDQPMYQSDAYILYARICLKMQNFEQAEKYLSECKSKYPQDYRILQYSITLNALQNKPEETLQAAKQFFAIAPGNPSAPQMIMSEYSNANVLDWLPAFFESTIKDYTDSISALQNLYFHYAYSLSILGKTDEVSQIAQKAKEAFNQNGSLTPEIENQLDSMVKNSQRK